MGLGQNRNIVLVEHPTTTADADGGYTTTYVPSTPHEWHCRFAPATTRDFERFAGGTVTAQATHVLRGRFHPGMTTQSRLRYGARVLNVVSVIDPESRHVDTECLVAEVVP
jgi:head-tail adaptor